MFGSRIAPVLDPVLLALISLDCSIDIVLSVYYLSELLFHFLQSQYRILILIVKQISFLTICSIS